MVQPYRTFLAVCLVLIVDVTSVIAAMSLYVPLTTNFTTDMNAALSGSSAEDYFIYLSGGVYSGCSDVHTIDLSPGAALSLTVIGAGANSTTIDCEDVVLMTSVFTCGANCTATLQDLTLTRVKMTTDSPDDVGALFNIVNGAVMTLKTVAVTSCSVVTSTGVYSITTLAGVSSVIRASGMGSVLTVVNSTFSSNTAVIGVISTQNSAHLFVIGSVFEHNTAGGAPGAHGLGGALSFAAFSYGSIARTTFSSHSARRGGVIYSYNSEVSLVDVASQESSTFFQGGSFFIYLSSLTSENMTIYLSVSDSFGGVVYSAQSVLFLTNLTTAVTGATTGGVLYCTSGSVTVDTMYASSPGAMNGGVIASIGSTVVVAKLTVYDSLAFDNGGVVYSTSGTLHFSNMTTINTRSNAGGGVFYMQSSSVTLSDVSTMNSVAVDSGGVVYALDVVLLSIRNMSCHLSSVGTSGGFAFIYQVGAATIDNVTVEDSVASTGGVFYCSESIVDFSNVLVRSSAADDWGGFAYSFLSVLNFEAVTTEEQFTNSSSSDSFLFHLVTSHSVFQGCTFVSNSSGVLQAIGQVELPGASTVSLINSAVFYSGPFIGLLLDSGSDMTALDSTLTVGLGTGLAASESSVNMSSCTVSVGPGGILALYLSSSSGSLFDSSFVSVSESGIALLGLFSSLHLTHSYMNASGGSMALATVFGTATLEVSQVVCTSYSPVVSVGTSWEVLASAIVGGLPLAFKGETSVVDSFLGVTTSGAPALTCDTTTHLAHSVTCGSSGALTSPSGTCMNGTTAVGSGQPNCHDACMTGSFCVVDDLDSLWFETFGCPRCGGACWLGTSTCNNTLAYCLDTEGGSFTCVCRTGYTGDGVQCEDIDECLEQDVCGAPRTVCLNTPGSFSCPCAPGTIFDNGLCREINECDDGLHNCDVATQCVDTPGSFTCECMQDTYGNGTVPCTPCPPHSSTQGQGALTLDDCLCAADFYMSAATCLACPANSSSVLGSLDSSDCLCEPFFFREAGEPAQSPCELCPAGRFANNERQCLACPSGSYSTVANASLCTSCQTGSSTNLQSGAVTCSCFPNYNSSGSGHDLMCTQACPPGWQTAGASCQVCGAGYYSQDFNSPWCTRCPPGATTATPTAASATECECLPGRIESDDSIGLSSACPLNCSAGNSYVVGLDQCTPCERGSYWSLDSLTGIGVCILCPSNSYTAGQGATSIAACLCNEGFAIDEQRGWCAVQCSPGFAVQATSCELCGPGTYSAQGNSFACTACPANAVTPPGATSLSNCSCSPDFFFEASSGECKACPSGALCAGGLAPPSASFGHFETDEGTFVECVPEISCTGGGSCLEGYEGFLCAGCSDGYFRVNGYCRPCSAPRSTLAALTLAILLLAAAAFILYNLGEDHASESAKASFGGLFIAFNSFQIIAMFGQLEIAWPSFVRQLLAALSLVFTFNVEVVGLECFSDTSGGEDSASTTTHPFVVSWLIGMFAPLYVAVSLLLGYCLLVLLHRCTPCASTLRGLSGSVLIERLKSSAKVSLVQALLLLYFPLAVRVFEVFQCVDNGTGTRVLAGSRDIICSEKQYSRLLGLGIAATLGYVVGIPTFLMASLYWVKTHSSEAELYDKAEVLVSKYRPCVFWYEGVVLARKAAVAAILLLLTPSPYLRAGGGAAVLLVFFMLNRVLSPYQLRWHNWIECSCLLSTIVFLEVGIAMQGTEWSDTAKVVVASLSLFAAMSIVLGAAGYELWWAQRVWRGLATDDISMRVYESGAAHQKRGLSVDEYASGTQTVGWVGRMDVLATVDWSSPQDLSVPFVPPPPPPPLDCGGDETSIGGSTNGAVGTGVVLQVPPPPSLGLLSISTSHLIDGGVASLTYLETIVPPPPLEEGTL